jgi:hypothetical protein
MIHTFPRSTGLKPDYVTIHRSTRGYFAVLMTWDYSALEYVRKQVSPNVYRAEAGAWSNCKRWGRSRGLKTYPPTWHVNSSLVRLQRNVAMGLA